MSLRAVGDHERNEALVAQFRVWAGEQLWIHSSPTLVQVWDCKRAYLEPRLDCWRCSDLVAIFLDLLPKRLGAGDPGMSLAVLALEQFIAWLYSGGLLDLASDPAPVLKGELQRLGGLFPSVVTACRRYGVDRPDGLLGWPPPLVLDGAELDERARAAPALVQLTDLVRFVGEGRRLTAAGNLRVADGGELVDLLGTADRFAAWQPQGYRTTSTTNLAEVDLLFRWALRAGFLEVAGTRVRPGPKATALVERPRRAWRLACCALVDIGVLASAYWGRDRRWRPLWCETLDGLVVEWLCARYRDGIPLPLSSLRMELLVHLERRHPQASWWAEADFPAQLHRDLIHILRRLVTLSAVWVDSGPDPEGADPLVQLSSLSQWLLRPLMVIGAHRHPLAAELSAAPAAVLCEITRAWPPDPAEVTVAAWIARRGISAATAELTDLATDVEDPSAHRWVFRALAVIGGQAEPTVRALHSVPGCRPLATGWLAGQSLSTLLAVEPRERDERTARCLARTRDLAGPELMARLIADSGRSEEQQVAMIEPLWTTSEPETSSALDALAQFAPDPLAPAARRTAMRHRNRSHPHP